MSKSYNNTIPLFIDEKSMRKKIMKIKTNSQLQKSPKKLKIAFFSIYSAFATKDEIKEVAKRYETGIGWGR